MGRIKKEGILGSGLAVVVLILSGLTIAACGSDGDGGQTSSEADAPPPEPEVTRAEFVTEADAVCRMADKDTLKKINKLYRKNGVEPVKSTDESRELTLDVSAELLRLGAVETVRAARLIGQLDAPAKFAGLVDRYVANTQSLGDQLSRWASLQDQIFKAYENGDSSRQQELTDREDAVAAEFEKASKRRNKAMKPIGFKVCAQ